MATKSVEIIGGPSKVRKVSTHPTKIKQFLYITDTKTDWKVDSLHTFEREHTTGSNIKTREMF